MFVDYDRLGCDIEFAEGRCPSQIHVLDHAGPGFVVGGHAVVAHLPVDLFLKFPRRAIVGIDIEDLFAALLRQVEAAAVVKALGFDEILFHLLDVGAEFWPDRLVVIIRLLEVGEEDDGLLAVRIVAVVEHDVQDILGILVVAVGDPLGGIA